ncbi:MAG: YeeE/YedE thiosulfate transporter family protein [Paracoccaceae bacterium]
MSHPRVTAAKASEAKRAPLSPIALLGLGIVFGFAFGFLLQKGGVGTYHILIGQLLFQDWTVAKIMLTAIVVGMIGIFTLHHFGKVALHTKPTKLASNSVGGLIFGAGFALAGYCPGTAAAAVGQGSWDALFAMVGLVAGSWMFAEMSATLKESIEKVGDLGKLTVFDVVPLPKWVTVLLAVVLLTGFLIILEVITAS